MKAILAILGAILLIGLSGAVMYDLGDILKGDQMNPSGAPWFKDDSFMYFGTGKDVNVSYDSSQDKFYINDTDVYLEEDTTIGGDATITGALAVGGATISGGKYDAGFTADDIKANATIYAVGAMTTNDLLTADNAKVNGTTYSVGALTSNSLATAANIKSNATIYAATTLNSGGTATLNAVVANTTVTAPADGIRANSVILPGAMVLQIPLSKAAITAGEINNSAWFIADDAWTITSIEEAHPVAEATAETLTVAVQKMTGTQALTGGINITEAAFNLKGAANTVQTGTLSKTAGRTTLADGDRIGIICNMTKVQGADEFKTGAITIHMKRV